MHTAIVSAQSTSNPEQTTVLTSDRAKVTPKLPHLWVTDIIAAQPLVALGTFAGVFSPETPPTDAVGQHILCLDPDTPELIWKAIAYELINQGCQVSVCQLGVTNYQPLEWYLTEATVPETAIHIVTHEIDWKDWVKGLDNSLDLEDALNLAKLAFSKIQDNKKRTIELDRLRRRCNVSSYDWNQYIRNLEAEIHSAVAGKTTDQKRLELQAIAQEKDPYKFTDRLIEFCRRTGWSRTDALQQIRLFKLGVRTPKAKRFKGKDFLAKETEALSWVFPGQIPARGITVLGGVAGSGKSTLAYDAAVSFLLNEEFLGEKPVKTGKILIVSSDELPCFIQDKLIDRGIPLDNEDWEILTDWDVSQWDILEETIEEIKPAFVVIDSFSSIHRDPNFDENSTQAKATIYDLEALSNSYAFGCVLIHHLSKGKDNKGVAKLRGSSAIAAACSVVALLEENPDGSRMLSFPKIRGAQTSSMRIALNSQTGRYEVLLGGDSASTKTLAQQILEFLFKEPSQRFTPEEIFHALGLTNKDSGHQALRRCFQRGQVVKRPNRTGRGSVYGIATTGLTPIPPSQKSLSIQQDTLSPLVEKVSVQIAETIETKATEVADTLTDTLPPKAQPLNVKKLLQVVGQVEAALWFEQKKEILKHLNAIKKQEGENYYYAAVALSVDALKQYSWTEGYYQTAIAKLTDQERAQVQSLTNRSAPQS
jgi:KaiC/GvpD/RAD55 family RecA-like ATPase